jgi:flagellar hook-associated protein 2
MAGTVSFLGISSSQNFNTIVDALVSAREQSQITPLKNFENQFSTKIASINKIDTALSSFYATLQGMDRLNEFLATTASSSDASVLAVSAEPSAAPGSHTLVVGTDVKHRLGSDGKADNGATVFAASGSSLQITVGGNTETVAFGSDSTLDQMASAINSQSALVSAEVMDDGSASNRYRLVLTSKTGGSAGAITVSNNTTSANFNLSPAQSVDSAEPGAGWGGTGAVASGGQYLGATNKTFSFTIAGSGAKTIGTDSFDVTWTDNEGNRGTIEVTDSSYANLSVSQGVTVSFGSPGQTVKAGDIFSVNVWNNTLQAGQDSGVAREEKEVHSGFADANSTAVTDGAAAFSYTYNGRQTTVSVSGGATLTGLVNLINADPANPGVTASIINDGTGLATACHLVLTGNGTGAACRITSISHTLDHFSGTFSESQAAQNAMLKVDGYPTGDVYVQRSGNHVTDAIAGLALELKDAGTTTVSIAMDTSAMVDKVKQFVTDFNGVKTAIRNETFFDTTTKQSGSLLGNYAVGLVEQQLNSLLTNSAPGFQDPDDSYVNLQQLGFSTDAADGSSTEGRLVLDEAALTSALSSNPNAVADLFASYLKGSGGNSSVAFSSAIFTTAPNIYEVQADTNPSSPNYRQGRFRVKGETSWHPWVNMGGSSGNYSLTGTSGPERGLAVQISYGDGHAPAGDAPDATIRVKTGIIAELSSTMQDILGTSGPLNTVKNNYNDIISNTDKRILERETRIQAYKISLQQRFAHLDAYINQVNQYGSFLTAFTSSVSTKSSTGS